MFIMKQSDIGSKRKLVVDMKAGDVFEHDGAAWMAVFTRGHTKDCGVNPTVWAVCLSSGHKSFGELSYFGDGSRSCSFVELEVEATCRRKSS